jgi:hypothetical protein
MKKIAFILLLTAFTLSVFGQKEDKFEKIRELKLEFLKKKLALTEDEEKKFIPLYEKFTDELEALHKSAKSDFALEDIDLTFMTDAECEKLITDIIDFKQKEVDLIKKYTAEFKKVLPVKKVAMIFKAEVEFRKQLFKKLKDKRKDKNKGDKGDKGDKGSKNKKEINDTDDE